MQGSQAAMHVAELQAIIALVTAHPVLLEFDKLYDSVCTTMVVRAFGEMECRMNFCKQRNEAELLVFVSFGFLYVSPSSWPWSLLGVLTVETGKTVE